jgi:branched-chain amino acid aminotransferase
MSLTIYLDGEYLPEDRARISVFDHGFLYGDGVFEGIRAYNGRVFRLREHVERLFQSAHAIMLEVPVTPEELGEIVLETCRRNQVANGYIRVVVSRGVGDLGIDPGKCKRGATVVVISANLTMYPRSHYEEGMSVITTATRRNSPAALDPGIKSLNYLNNILAKIEVNRAGAGEGIMLNLDGYVAEATGDNIFIVQRGVLYTPPAYIGILEGITRNSVIEIADRLGIPFAERVFTQLTVYNSDECFLTGTGAEVIPVVRVDDRTIGDGRPGPMTRQIMQAFHELVNREGTEINASAGANPAPVAAAEG